MKKIKDILFQKYFLGPQKPNILGTPPPHQNCSKPYWILLGNKLVQAIIESFYQI